LVFLGKFGLMFLIPYIGDLVPSNAIMGLLYILAGAAK
jgi:hypothetical protein